MVHQCHHLRGDDPKPGLLAKCARVDNLARVGIEELLDRLAQLHWPEPGLRLCLEQAQQQGPETQQGLVVGALAAGLAFEAIDDNAGAILLNQKRLEGRLDCDDIDVLFSFLLEVYIYIYIFIYIYIYI